MPVNLILAPAAAGKTRACLQRIQSLHAAEPFAPVWVLVPDAQNAAYFRQRMGRIGGGMGVNVGTFRVLFTDLLERQGRFSPVITSALEHRLVQQIVEAAHTAGELDHYAAIKAKPGFISILQDVFSELRSAYISPDQFLVYTSASPRARQELATLYARFIAQLEEIGWIDHDGQVWEVITALEDDLKTAAHIRLLIVDGFSAFAGARLEFLKRISVQVGEMLITLPGVQGSTRAVDRRTRAVIQTLLNELSPRVTELSSAPYLPRESKYLEQHILEPGETPKMQASTPFFLETQNQGEEAREALRWVKRLYKRHGVPLSDCALFVSHLDTYRPHLRAAADEFGVKIRFSHPDSLMKSPAVQSLLNLLEMPPEDFTTRAVINALRSPYFDFGLDEKDIDHLELVSQVARIVVGQEQWTEAWEMLSTTRRDSEEPLDDERQISNPLRAVDLTALRQRFVRFWQVFDGIETPRTQTEWVAWLESTLTNLQFYNQLSGERDMEAWQALGESMGSLILSEQVLGRHPVSYEHFLSILLGAIQGARLDEPREAKQNAVFVNEIQHAVASRFKAVALLGFSEGLFPVVEHPDPFLDEHTRADLGLDPRLGREQVNTFYQAFTRADHYLLFTRPYLAEHGERWEASPYWLSAVSLFEKEAVQKISPNRVRPQAEAASPQELLFWAVQQQDLHYKDDDELVSGWKQLAFARTILNARRMKVPQSQYEGDLSAQATIFEAIFSPDHTWSASRFETYATCPHQFFIQNLLKLEPKKPPELGLDAAQIGSILHDILEKVYRAAEDTTDLDALLSNLESHAASVFAQAPHKEVFRPSPLWEVEKDQFIAMLRKTIEALHAESMGWTPIRFEEKFGISNTPALVLDLGAEEVRLRGLIDRVDRNEFGGLRIIDYKTGGSNLSNKDLISGRRLQMPIYAQAAQQALRLGTVKEGFYWQIRAAKPSSFKLSKFKNNQQKGPQAAYTIALDHIRRMLGDVRSGSFPPIAPGDGCPSYCPAVQWCWRYQPGYWRKRNDDRSSH
ncbi:MAG: ATP-dependent helicase/deoxyribonuclease subunit B [Chloroflexi bacterium ADurb.Bin120]|uniref:UvrD-like helicase C-terminal domain-containing protein n=1 Tax=Candidatus Brevifilum fermentans TaxID=1986204 RepID=A0A1Y6K5Y4_9CHLR|nr:PD-(D/E)XK nuclease family protein [Brevefilum fermentans]MDI9565824.1 PD-(D/E)XK nuclease family protein [Chloroflexota bacterium]OQB86072.1 MAG: ATP-dependent helicase/deoxyribonuclease subunit B [Chloroflexi bacterium ADurb.Bin120]SMX55122.1 protein of unknown function [Brevefilum fermentans]